MPPRLPLVAALRRPLAFLRPAQAAKLSTSLPAQALKDIPSPEATQSESSPSSASASPTPTPQLSSTTSAILGLERPSRAPPSGPLDPTNAVSGLFDRMTAPAPNGNRPRAGGLGGSGDGGLGGSPRRRFVDEDLREKGTQDDYARQMTRRWRAGDVYAPHDLSPSEMGKWRRNRARKQDLVDILGLKPLDMYRNFSVISEFMTTHGRIKRSVETGLRPANQRKMAKAIRRAIGLGLHPSVHHHPEILARDPIRRLAQNQPTVYNHKI
ncbi:hypothetical protein SLS62_001983 [Diatrype stigma]|uniref:Small ribosomal subunit protein bS18m n=1 Tax=Diatrype stigma TaxID=117547 RepID=A0AAN9V117_9PEZI